MTEEQTQTVTTGIERRDPLQGVLFALAVLALALAPTHLVVPVTHTLSLHPTEPVLLLAMLVWAVRWLQTRNSEHLPPLSHWLLVCAAGVGVFIIGDVVTPDKVHSGQVTVIKETAQTVFYLLLAYPVFRTALNTPARLRIAVIALLFTTTLATLLGVEQRLALQYGVHADRETQPHNTQTIFGSQSNPRKRVVFDHSSMQAYLSAQQPHNVCSTFATWDEHGYHPSRNTYAGFLALVLPFALALLVSERKRAFIVLWMALLFAAAAVSVLAGYVMPAILIGLLVTGFSLGAQAGRWTVLGIGIYLLAVAVIGGFNRQEILQEPFQLRISAEQAQYYGDGARQLKKFWGEQQAALNVVRSSPLFGVGAGRYQDAIGLSYDLLGKIDIQRDEPGAVNGYLVAAAGMGLLGLAALLLLYGRYIGLARCAMRARLGMPWSAALMGSMAALLLLMLATTPWVRGTSVVLIAWLAAIANFATPAPAGRMKNEEENPCE